METAAEQQVHEAAKRRETEGGAGREEEEGFMTEELPGDTRLVLKIKGGHRMHTVIGKVLEALQKVKNTGGEDDRAGCLELRQYLDTLLFCYFTFIAYLRGSISVDSNTSTGAYVSLRDFRR